MTITPENPLGLDGFEFVEFTSPDPQAMTTLLEQMGFTAYSRHRSKDVVRYKQGRINLLVNQEASGQVADFRAAHGPSANGMAFRVADAAQAYEIALSRGAKAADASLDYDQARDHALKLSIRAAEVRRVLEFSREVTRKIDR
ncbi:MAG TPA: hypothetical protein PKA17_06515, partial [Phenylobacterium sp.]|nr:hypothetical protein [Phenylobacterium sp.]